MVKWGGGGGILLFMTFVNELSPPSPPPNLPHSDVSVLSVQMLVGEILLSLVPLVLYVQTGPITRPHVFTQVTPTLVLTLEATVPAMELSGGQRNCSYAGHS